MAVANSSSNAALVKAVLLPLTLVLLAMAAGASSTEDGSAVAKSGGRFSETPVGRKLLAAGAAGNSIGCGAGSAPNYECRLILGADAKKPTCCKDANGNKACFDVGSSMMDKCGSCTTTCKMGETCCSGVCKRASVYKSAE